MEHGPSSNKNKSNKTNKLGSERRISKKKFYFKGKYFNYDMVKQKSANCKLLKTKKDYEANMVNGISKDVSKISISTVVSKVNLVSSNSKEW